MTETTGSHEMDCARARTTLHGLLDGDALEPLAERAYRDHLAVCSGCREADRDLQMIHDQLRALPLAELSETALERVWRRTVRSEAANATDRRLRRSWIGWAGLDWRAVAAAAALAAVLLGVHTARPQPTEAELNQAAAEARMALLLAARALRDTEEAVLRDVLVEKVALALGRAPIPGPPRQAEEGSR